MKKFILRALLLLTVFCGAFISVIVIQKFRNGYTFSEIISGEAFSQNFKKEDYTLRDLPTVKLDDVKVLAAINAESASLIRAVIPSVVSIDTSGVRHERVRDMWGRRWVQPRAVQGQGSGVIVTEEGHVLTNHHVIKGTPNIRLTMHDGSVYSASVIGQDPSVDMAVLKIDADEKFIPLKFGNSTEVEVGNMVFAIGNPFGIGTSVTEGRISALKRPFSDSQVDLLQTSAAINPGNSGGPLINVVGEIVGINSRIYSTNRDSPGFQGIGFAIPANAAKKTLTDILDRGRPIRGYLGMAMENLDPVTRMNAGYEGKQGVRVISVIPDSPAMDAGLQANDIIISYRGQPVINMRRLIDLIQQSKVGSEVSMKVWRSGEEQDITAVIGDADNMDLSILEDDESDSDPNQTTQIGLLGIEVRETSLSEKTKGIQGLVITRISSTSQLRGKILTGDRIIALNRIRMSSASSFKTALNSSLKQKESLLSIQRGNSLIQIRINQFPDSR